MIAEFALFSLMLSFCVALIQCFIPSWGLYRNNIVYINFAKPCAVLQLIFLMLSLMGLFYAFLSNDFSIQYVTEHSTHSLPWYYRIGAIWGGHEGSFLLWIVIINTWAAIWLFFNKSQTNEWIAAVLAIMGAISASFLFFLIKTSNPFARNYLLDMPAGQDLNPLLQDPGLLMHPPMLYFGYVGFVIVFALALAGLIQGNIDQQWARSTRPWAILAWMMLTIGIILGSWWAYHVLGWGGWWFWDPVENAALLPWLIATALIHSLIVTERTGALKSWSLLLAILIFILCIVGTFLVRSGILVSVHTFANDPARGMLLLVLLAVIGFFALLIYAKRAPYLQSQLQPFHLVSRESCILANNLLLLVLMMTVLLGTLYPVIMQILGSTRLSVGAPYFNAVFIPIAIPLFMLMGIAPECYWNKTDVNKLLRVIKPNIVISIVLALFAAGIFTQDFNLKVLLGSFLSAWLICSTTSYYARYCWRNKRLTLRQLSMFLAHIGVAIMIMAVTVVSQLTTQIEMRVSPGEQFQLGKYTFTLEKVGHESQANYDTATVYFKVDKNQRALTTMKVEQREYRVAQTAINMVSIKPRIFYDLYLVLGEQFNDNSWAVRAYYKPMIRWIWLGGLLLVLGGMSAIVNIYVTRRRKILI